MSNEPSPADEQLVRRAQSGDRGALVMLYDRYVGEVYGYALHQLGSVQDAEDVTSEIFLRLVDRLRGFRRQSSFRTWLYAIARSQIREHWRRAARRPRTVELDLSTIAAPEAAPEPAASGRATALGRRLLAELPPRYRRVLELRVLDGRSIRDTALEMNITPNHVKVLQHRALKRAAQIADELAEASHGKPGS